MKVKLSYGAVLLLVALCVSAFLGARTVAEEQARSNFDRDVVEFDRTREHVAAQLNATAESLKQVAREATPEKEGDLTRDDRFKKIFAS